jgi:enolase-phosphatase E1
MMIEDDPTIRIVLLDIEGTTSSISFVSDVLFPYVRKELKSYLNSNWENTQLKEDIELLR